VRPTPFSKASGILIVFLILIGTAAADTLPFTFKANPFHPAKDVEGYDVLRMAEFETAAVPGRPILPRKIFYLAVPPDINWDSIELTVTTTEKEKCPGFFNIKTCPPDTAWNGSQWLTSSPGVDDFQSGAAVRLIGVSQLRKWRFVKVEFAPFQYTPGTGELALIKKADILLSYARTGEQPSALELQDGVMDDIARDLFLNYSQAGEWYRAGAASADVSQILPTNYVIITTEAIRTNSTKLNAFVAHKQDMGYTVEVVTETTWGAVTGQSPNNKAEKIREWLKTNFLSLGIKYVLLIGNPSPYESGEGDVPQKMCWPRLGSGADENAPTDYFYADLTGNWNIDGDAYYGEWSQDMGTGGVDFAPEVYVGRIPVYSAAYSTLDAILQKIISYERAGGSIAWRKSILLPMGFQSAGYDGAPLAEQMSNDYLAGAGYTSFRQYQQGTAFAADNSTYTSEEELRGNTIVRDRWAANDYGIVCWWGHGSATSAAVGYDPNWDGNLFYYTYCSSLDDAHPAFTYQCSCTNAYPENSNNLAYSILKAGGIETVSASRVSWFNTGVVYGGFDGSTTNSGIGYEYVRRLVVNEYAAGNALYLAKSSMTPEANTRLMNYYDFNLYGDPSLSLQKVYQGDDGKHAAGDFDGDASDEVAMDFGAIGAWMWNGGAWSQLTPSNPERMISIDIDGNGDAELAVDLGASGLWLWNGGVWSQLNGNDPEDIIAADTNHNNIEELFVDFGATGLWWRQESGTLSMLSALDPQNIIAADLDANGDQEVAADFGMMGLWRWERAGGTWAQLTAADASALISVDVDNDGDQGVAADLVSFGVWLWDSGTWTQLSGIVPDRLLPGKMVAGGGEEIAGDFGAIGLWLWAGGAWSQISGVNPDELMTADVDGNGVDEIVGDFASLGLWIRNGGVWSLLTGVNPEGLLAGDIDADEHDELVVDFGTLGVWLWNDGTWSQVSTSNPD
jgi:hypothetical protein